MNSFIIFTLLVAGVFAAPADKKNNADVDDNAKMRISHGIARRAAPDEQMKDQGAYEYLGKDNVRHLVNYKAGNNGYQPIADELPKYL